MKTNEFFNLLEQHTDKALLFEYAPNMLVGANYHITEVKHITVDAVDCGANTDAWKETIVQLYESPQELGKTEYMTVYKALAILAKVGRMKPYQMDAELKIEYSNAHFHTAQLFVHDVLIGERQLRIQLGVAPTDCKAKDSCGIPETASATPEAANSCAPGSGCC